MIKFILKSNLQILKRIFQNFDIIIIFTFFIIYKITQKYYLNYFYNENTIRKSVSEILQINKQPKLCKSKTNYCLGRQPLNVEHIFDLQIKLTKESSSESQYIEQNEISKLNSQIEYISQQNEQYKITITELREEITFFRQQQQKIRQIYENQLMYIFKQKRLLNQFQRNFICKANSMVLKLRSFLAKLKAILNLTYSQSENIQLELQKLGEKNQPIQSTDILNMTAKEIQLDLPKQASILDLKMDFENLNQQLVSQTTEQTANDQINHVTQLESETEQKLDQFPCTLLLGYARVGKTTLVQQLVDQNDCNLFQPYFCKEINCQFIDTEAFNMEDSIDYREDQISKYRILFEKINFQINNLMILVNFDRIDYMKWKFSNVFKFFTKFQTIISLIITDFFLIDDESKDKEEIIKLFSSYKIKAIKFIGKGSSKKETIEAIQDIYENQIQQKLDLEGTIFENDNLETIVDSLKQQFE